MNKISKYIFLIFIVILLFIISSCSNNYNRKSIMDETRKYLNEIESGTFISKQEIIFKNKNQVKIKELKFTILPNGSRQKDFDHKSFKFKISVKLENNDIETQEVELSKFLGLDSYKFEFSMLDTKFEFNLIFCKDRIILYTKNHENSQSLNYGIFYNELAIFLDKVM